MSLLAVVLAFAASALLFARAGKNPLWLGALLQGSLGSADRIAVASQAAVPAHRSRRRAVLPARHHQYWARDKIALGACRPGRPPVPQHLRVLPALALGAGRWGAPLGRLAAVIRLRRGVHEVLVTDKNFVGVLNRQRALQATSASSARLPQSPSSRGQRGSAPHPEQRTAPGIVLAAATVIVPTSSLAHAIGFRVRILGRAFPAAYVGISTRAPFLSSCAAGGLAVRRARWKSSVCTTESSKASRRVRFNCRGHRPAGRPHPMAVLPGPLLLLPREPAALAMQRAVGVPLAAVAVIRG